MAMYKIPQDVEADQKFLWVFSFKQFIFAGIAAVALYIAVTFLFKAYVVSIFMFPIGAFFGILAWPWSKYQPTEILIAARIRFMLKPKMRIWNQLGLKHLVTINVPKHEKIDRASRFTNDQAHSRADALSQLLDSRGWAVKRSFGAGDAEDTTSMVASPDANPDPNDVLDERNTNTIATNIDKLMSGSRFENKQYLSTILGTPAPAPQPQTATPPMPQAAVAFGRPEMNISNPPNPQPAAEIPQQKVTNPDIINLSRDRNSSIQSLSRMGNQALGQDPLRQGGEVSISLR